MGKLSNILGVSRWRFRFGLRTMLVVTAVLAGLSAWLGSHWLRTRVQRPIVAQIEAARGTVFYDYQISEYGEIDRDASPPGWKPLRAILGDDFFAEVHGVTFNGLCDPRFTEIEVERFTQLRIFNLSGVPGADGTLRRTAALKKLEFLWLFDGEIRPETLGELSMSESIKRIKFAHIRLTDDHFQQLANFRRLHELQFWNVAIDDEGLMAIAECRKLRKLHFWWNLFHGVEDARPDDWSPLANLRELTHFSTNVSNDSTFQVLSHLIELQSLDINGLDDHNSVHLKKLVQLKQLQGTSHSLTDNGLDTVSRLATLEHLDVRPGDFTDGGILKLATMPSLKTLNLTLTPTVTRKGVDALRKAMPNCKIETYDFSGDRSDKDVRDSDEND